MHLPSDKLLEIVTYIFKLLNNYKEIYIINKSLECLNLIIKKTTIINSNHLTGYYNIYLNLHKYDLCNYEIYKLIDNLISLFKTNTQNKENFINLLLNNNYKIKF
jgi:hypothetical protein